VILGFVFWTGHRGIDFGHHWDEPTLLYLVQHSAESGLLLPRWYNYSSVLYDVAVASLLPDASLADLLSPRRVSLHGPAGSKHLPEVARSQGYLFRLRTVCLLLATLAPLWVYLWVLRWRDDPLEALLAGTTLASSWELAYHARWPSPDPIMAMLAVATMLCVWRALDGGRRSASWLQGAAILAGLACGTKYPGGLLLLPVLGAGALLRHVPHPVTGEPGANTRLLAKLVAWFGVSFLASTPGAALEPWRFLADVRFEMNHYAQGHGGYTVVPFTEHGPRLLAYLGLSAFSRAWPLALMILFLAGWGAVRLVRVDRARALLFLVVPVADALYMIAQKVMIVRNALVLLPFLAVLAAHGFRALHTTLPHTLARRALAAAFAGTLIFNLVELEQTSQSIAQRKSIDHAADLARYLDAAPRRSIRLSPGAAALLGPRAHEIFALGGAQAAKFVLLTSEVKDWRRWPANRHGLYHLISGPLEVNFDYYPSWEGDPRLVAMPMEAARAAHFVR